MLEGTYGHYIWRAAAQPVRDLTHNVFVLERVAEEDVVLEFRSVVGHWMATRNTRRHENTFSGQDVSIDS